MPTRNCPNADGGLCFEPDAPDAGTTVIAYEGSLSVLSPELTHRIFPEGIALQPEAFLIGEFSQEKFSAEIVDSIFGRNESRLQAGLKQAIGYDQGLLIRCSCGHVVMKRTVS